MIATDRRTPQQALADALGGEVLGPSSIAVGTTIITVSPVGKVRVGSTVIGAWSDPTATLAERARAVIGGAA